MTGVVSHSTTCEPVPNDDAALDSEAARTCRCQRISYEVERNIMIAIDYIRADKRGFAAWSLIA